jgi:hypothetical protein
MASTITSQTLTVTISTTIMLNGQATNSENQYTVSGINEINKRIMTIPFASEVSILSFGAAVAAGTLISGDVKYVQITNKDDTNFIRLRIKKAGADTFDVKIDAGKSFIIGNTKESVSSGAGAFSAFVDFDNISAQADTANVDIEYFVASI